MLKVPAGPDVVHHAADDHRGCVDSGGALDRVFAITPDEHRSRAIVLGLVRAQCVAGHVAGDIRVTEKCAS